MTKQQKVACPKCGDTDNWVAYYYVGRKAYIDLFRDEDGKLVADNYDCDDSVDDDTTEDTDIRCGGCDAFFPLAVLKIEAVAGDPLDAEG